MPIDLYIHYACRPIHRLATYMDRHVFRQHMTWLVVTAWHLPAKNGNKKTTVYNGPWLFFRLCINIPLGGYRGLLYWKLKQDKTIENIPCAAPLPRPPPRPRPLQLPRPAPKYTTDKVRQKYSHADRRHYRYLLVRSPGAVLVDSRPVPTVSGFFLTELMPLVPVHKQTSRQTLIDI